MILHFSATWKVLATCCVSVMDLSVKAPSSVVEHQSSELSFGSCCHIMQEARRTDAGRDIIYYNMRNCTCFSKLTLQHDRVTFTNTISKYCQRLMDMFLKHGCFLQPALCQRNNNRKVAITLLFSSHSQMAEITGLLRL